MIETTMRNASLDDLSRLLIAQQTHKIDAVVPAADMGFTDGNLVISSKAVQLDEHGVTQIDGEYRPTAIFDEGLSDKLSIPLPYLRRMRNERVDLYDANANGWLHGVDGGDPDQRSFLVRGFRGANEEGIARAFLSDKYRPIDNLDVLTAVLQGVKESGADVQIAGCDLTERRMQVRVLAPGIEVLAPDLLRGYRSPYSGLSGEDIPQVFAGFVFGNSETGGGAFTVTPRIVFKVCANGMTITKDALRNVHLGGKLEEGVIRWSDETQRKSIELVTSRTKDAVKTFLNIDYMRSVIAGLEEKSHTPVKAAGTVEIVAKKLAFDAETTQGILEHFIKGGQVTAGGIMQAVTSYAQSVDDPDKAARLEDMAIPALECAASL